MATLELEALTKRFGERTAVDSVSLTVSAGEIFGFLGPNGAGKTTTIRMILDLIRPDAGAIRVLGRSPRDPSVRTRLVHVPADVVFDRRHTTDEEIELSRRLRRAPDRRRADELCERFSLDPRRPIGELSTGNRRKAAIVVAFMHDPELFVLDEPTSGLDPLLQHEFHDLVRERARAGTAVFLSSHALAEVETLADRVGILRTGRLVRVAGLEELRREARQTIEFVCDHPVEASRFEGARGVVDATPLPRGILVTVEGDVGPTLAVAATLDVRRLITRDDDLDEVFRQYYAGETS